MKEKTPQEETISILVKKLVKSKTNSKVLKANCSFHLEQNDVLRKNISELTEKNANYNHKIRIQNQKINEMKTSLSKLHEWHLQEIANVIRNNPNPHLINYDVPQILKSEYFIVLTNGNHNGEFFEAEIVKVLKDGGGAKEGTFTDQWNKKVFDKPKKGDINLNSK